MTEQYEPIDPYANPIDDDTAAAMVAESKALYEIAGKVAQRVSILNAE